MDGTCEYASRSGGIYTVLDALLCLSVILDVPLKCLPCRASKLYVGHAVFFSKFAMSYASFEFFSSCLRLWVVRLAV